jgi:prepilin-type N-terminal cleavage/methylation domain-containing protein
MRKGFTLAEVLITLGIIGVVAALVMPGLINNYRKMVLKNQFRKVYSMISQAYRKTEADLGYTPLCFYWTKIPLHKCVAYSAETGFCTAYLMADDSPLPPDINGSTADCAVFKEQFFKNLKVVKKCSNKSVENGCIVQYKGNDELQQDDNPDISQKDINKNIGAECINRYSKNAISNTEAYVLADSTVLFNTQSLNAYAVDLNGKKGPNKWGYDVFALATRADSYTAPLILGPGRCTITEKGGIIPTNMIIDMNK